MYFSQNSKILNYVIFINLVEDFLLIRYFFSYCEVN